MRAVVQRCMQASVTVDGEVISRIKSGFLVLLGVECGDTESDLTYITEKIAALRIFSDENGKMNLDIMQSGGEILLVSQFTLCGDARHGRRPDYFSAARPQEAEPLYLQAISRLQSKGIVVQGGRFGADMQVALVNDGPVTLLLDSKKTF